MTSTDHRILEGATSSVVCARHDDGAAPTLLTPEPSRGVLPGTSQARIFDAARERGWAVDYVTEATLTFAMTHPDGQRYSPADIKARTELVLAGRFARICTVEDALSGPALPLAA